MDVRDDTAARDRGLDERVELLITRNGELEVTRRDTLHLEVLGRVAGKLENLSGKVLEDGSRVDGGRGSDAAVGRDARLEVTVDTADRELEAGALRAGLGGLRGLLAVLSGLRRLPMEGWSIDPGRKERQKAVARKRCKVGW